MTDDPENIGPRPGDSEPRRVPNPRRNEPVRENPAPPLGSPMTIPPRAHAGGLRENPAPPLGHPSQQGVPLWAFGAFAVAVLMAAVAGVFVYTQMQNPPAPQVAAAPAPAEPLPLVIDDYTPPDPLTARRADVTVHNAPDAAAPVVERLRPGDVVFVTGRVADTEAGWLVVPQADGSRGFVSASDLMPLRTWNEANAPRYDAPAAAPRTPPQRQQQQRRPRPDPNKPLNPADTISVPVAPQWLSRPSPQEVYSVYPQRAARMGVSGAALLGCEAQPNGLLSCMVLQENPIGLGFGAAAMQLVPRYRLQPRLQDGRSVAGLRLQIPVVFRI